MFALNIVVRQASSSLWSAILLFSSGLCDNESMKEIGQGLDGEPARTNLAARVNARIGTACALHPECSSVHIEHQGEHAFKLSLYRALVLVRRVLQLEALIGCAIVCHCCLVCAKALCNLCKDCHFCFACPSSCAIKTACQDAASM